MHYLPSAPSSPSQDFEGYLQGFRPGYFTVHQTTCFCHTRTRCWDDVKCERKSGYTIGYISHRNKSSLAIGYISQNWNALDSSWTKAGRDKSILVFSWLRPSFVTHYFSHELQINNHSKRHILAVVVWFKEHPNKDYFGNPVEVWREKECEDGGACSFLPVQRITLESLQHLHRTLLALIA